MNPEAPAVPRSLPLILITATLQGLALWWLANAVELGLWPATGSTPFSVVATLAVFLPPMLYALSDWIRQPRCWLVLGLAAVLLVVFGAQQAAASVATRPDEFVTSPLFGSPLYFLTLFILVFHALPFVQCLLENGHWRPRYEQLFHFAWRNALLLALIGLFFLVTLLLLGVWAQLFKMIGFDFFMVVFFESGKPLLFIAAVVFGTGYLLSGTANRLLLAVRNQVLSLLKWLALLATVILVSFTLTLAVRSPVLFAAHERVISATWLLWLVILMIYLYNAAYQDGSIAQPYPKRMGQLLRAAMPLLVFVAGLAVYAILIRTFTYGLTSERFWAVVVALFALAYALGYAWAARSAAAWMADMGGVNTLLAAALVLVLALTLTPVLAPDRLAADSQYRRILADPAKAETSAAAYALSNYSELRFRTGQYGMRRLQELAALTNHPQQAMIRAAAARTLAQDSPWVSPRAQSELQLEAFPAGAILDAGLRAALTRAVVDATACTARDPCAVLLQDLDGDGVPEAVLFAGYAPQAFRRLGGKWTAAGQVVASPNDRCCRAADVLAALRRGDFRTVTPRWQQLQLGNRTYTFAGP
ncbi:MAG TPA: hypothetical protein VMI92_09235 [Steroidobacteraceae bacterium]|nr:hypothetical protein [Steroidobacteraceae bacterium]